MSTALTVPDHNQALAIQGAQRLSFTDEERRIIRESFMPGASDAEARPLLAVAETLRLSPFKRQIHFVKRWNREAQREVWSFQTSIDGYRSIAEESGEFIGADEPEFYFAERINPATGEPTGKKELACKVRVWRKGFEKPFVGNVRYSEFVQTTKDGTPNAMWAKSPHNMLAKCAESAAIRKAFPQRLAGVHGEEDGRYDGHDDVVATVAPASTAPIGKAKKPVASATDQVLDVAANVAEAAAKPAVQVETQADRDRADFIEFERRLHNAGSAEEGDAVAKQIAARWPDKTAQPRQALAGIYSIRRKAKWHVTPEIDVTVIDAEVQS
jgi:phage recombination protein Bet